jgi:hypothetical protein
VRSVRYCESSTITEAWAVVLGAPAAETVASVQRAIEEAQAARPELEIDPSFVVATGNADLIEPHWHTQLRWSNGVRVARVGHQYVAVHFLSRAGKYETYQASLQPDVAWWWERWATGPAAFEPRRVVFGYVNTFEFEEQDFALGDYFNVAAELRGPITAHAVDGYQATFRLTVGCVNPVHLSILVDNLNLGSNEEPRLVRRVVVKTVANRGCMQSDVMGVLAELETAKALAKDSFFDFACERTHQRMGAMY